MLSRQLALLRNPASFGLLSLATLASGLGTWVAFVALTVDVYDRTGSATWVSALFIADFLPAIVIGIAAGSLVDRVPRRRLMIASDLVRVVVFAALPFAGSAAMIVGRRGLRHGVLPPRRLCRAAESGSRRGTRRREFDPADDREHRVGGRSARGRRPRRRHRPRRRVLD